MDEVVVPPPPGQRPRAGPTGPRRTRAALAVVVVGEILFIAAVLIAAIVPDDQYAMLPPGELVVSLVYGMVGALVLLVPAALVVWGGPRWLVATVTPILLVIATSLGLAFAFIVYTARADEPWHDA